MTPIAERLHLDMCFVAPKAWFVFSGRSGQGHVGGAEVQQCLLAREMVARGHRVTLVTWDYGQADGIDCDGIRVFKMCPPEAGWRGVRFVHPRWSSLRAALHRADAAVYYQRSAGVETGQVSGWCRSAGRHFVYAVASQPECDPALSRWGRIERHFFRRGLRGAGSIVAQTVGQRQRLESVLNRPVAVVPSCAPDPGWHSDVHVLRTPRLLWIGRIARYKGLHHALDMAAAYPDIALDVVGGFSTEDDYATAMRQRAAELSNVTLHGAVAHDRVDAFYAQAAAVLCTSDFEGFPNTFLEAWSRGVPVASLWDDQVVAAHGVGVVAATPAALGAAVAELLGDTDRWTALSGAVRAHFLRHHTVDRAVDAYEDLLHQCGAAVEREG